MRTSTLGFSAAAILAVLVTARLGQDQWPENSPHGGHGGGGNNNNKLVISPTPQKVTISRGQLRLSRKVQLVVDSSTDASALSTIKAVLGKHGVRDVVTVSPGQEKKGRDTTTIRLGSGTRSDIKSVLGSTTTPSQEDGYALVVNGDKIAIGGEDGPGQFYGVQTFSQLFTTSTSNVLAQVAVQDYPLMPLRGTIEGFYGEPWSDDARLDHVAWLGTVKANTYVYTPKDDAYLRDEWRDPYPADKLATIKTLIDRSTANHVRFTYAVSPGISVCFSSQADKDAMLAKLQQVYDIGARAFSIPFDDISYGKWNCDGDKAAFGEPGQGPAGQAQVDFLNYVQKNFIQAGNGTFPLQMVPTEYSDLKDSPYKTAIRTHLDSAVVVQWTGTDVVPPSVTNAQAQACAANFGRKVFLWDNYPVNDFGQTEGRLLLGPYRYREKGLHNNLLGNVGNPMNQAYASRIVLFGVNDFAWNDEGFDADRSWVASMRQLADGDSRTVDALLVLSDMEQAPTFGPNPWQPPSPVLAAKVAKVNGTKHEARDLRDLLTYATAIVSAPNTIRRCSALPPGFLVDVGSWLDAMTKWGTALIAAVQAQQALDRGDKSAAAAKVAVVNTNVAAAKALRVTPAVNRWGSVAPVLANGVMDKYIQLVVDRVKA